MSPPRLLILADDLTGAADTAGQFAAAGLATLVCFSPAAATSAEVLSLSTHSRHLSPKDAAQAQRRALAGLGGIGTWIYKKIDSTLRGQPAVELWAVMDTLGIERALVAPAFPSQGRTTVGGRQLVEGQPLEQTAFGGNSDLLQVFAAAGPLVGHLDLEAVRGEGLAELLTAEGIHVADAAGDEDLRSLARAAAAAGVRLLCGSAGLARALRESGLLGEGMGSPALSAAPAGPALVVAGSRHSRTAEQVLELGSTGALVLGLGERVVEQAAAVLGEGRNVVLGTMGLAPGDPEEVAACLARTTGEILCRSRAGGLVLTGGDIALAVCAVLGGTGLWLRGEVEAGIPWGLLSGGAWEGMRVVTKAGGFGGDRSLVGAVELLKAGIS